MKRSSWIIVSLSVFYLCYAIDPNQPVASSTSAPRAVSGLDEFVRKGTGVVQMANGVIIQGQLLENADNVYSVAADLLHVNSTAFSQIVKSKLDGVMETVTQLQVHASEYKSTLKSGDLRPAVTVLLSVIGDLGASRGEFNNGTVALFTKTIAEVRGNLNFDLVKIQNNVLPVIECIKKTVTNDEIDVCFKAMQLYTTYFDLINSGLIAAMDYKSKMNNLLLLMKYADELRKAFASVHGLSEMKKQTKSLQLFSTSIVDVVNIMTKYEGIRKVLKETSRDEFDSLLRVALKRETEVPFEFTQGLPGGTGDLAALFRNMEKGGMLETVIADGLAERLDLLKTVLIPLEKFSGQMTEVEGMFGGWRSISESGLSTVQKMNSFLKTIDEWTPFSSSDAESAKKCFANLFTIVRPDDENRVRRGFELTTELSTRLHSFFEALDAMVSFFERKSMFEKLEGMIKDKLVNIQNGPQDLPENLGKLFDAVSADGVMAAFLNETRHRIKVFRGIDTNKTSSLIREFSDVKFLEKNLQSSSEFLKIMDCFTKYSGVLNGTRKVLDTVEMFEALKNYSFADMKSGLDGLLKTQKLMEEVHANWTTLGKETRRRRRDDMIDEYRKALILDEQSFPGLLTGLEIVKRMRDAHGNVGILMKSLKIQGTFKNEFAEEWRSSGERMTETTINELHALEVAVSSGTVDLAKIKKVYGEASKMRGVRVNWKLLDDFLVVLNTTNNSDAADVFTRMKEMRLDFEMSTESWRLVFLSLSTLRSFLLDVFGESPSQGLLFFGNGQMSPLLFLIGLVVGIFLAVCILSAVAYVCTPSGRSRLKRFRVSRFGSLEDIELYWRYSFYLDQEMDRNTLLEAVRDVNYEQVKTSVRNGAYVNVYNGSGQTSLHLAVKYGHVSIAKTLIRNGANREALNAENKTAEQMLTEYIQSATRNPTQMSESQTSRRPAGSEKMGSFKEVAELFEKYRNKTFRPTLPDLLPTMAYRVRVDDRVTHRSTDQFIEAFRGNITDQKLGVTHFILPTGKGGVFKSDDFGYIMCVFLPTILMEERWMSECLENKSNFRDDYKFRVKKVKYKGVVYETVLKWAGWVHKQMLPYLYGVRLHVAIADFAEGDAVQLRLLVEMHGAVWCDEMPVKEQFNVGSHPFHHQNMGPLFVIHDGKTNLDHLRNDSDRMYTLMTFEEFVIFMLKMEVTHNKKKTPLVPVSIAQSVNESSSFCA